MSEEGHKWVYSYGKGYSEGDNKMRNLLGGKGVGLAEMTSIGVPVPPGFTITTEVCNYYYDHNHTYPKDLWTQVDAALDRVEKDVGTRALPDSAPGCAIFESRMKAGSSAGSGP